MPTPVATPTPIENRTVQWTCKFKEALPESVTVGTKLTLSCDGAPAGFTSSSAENLKFGLPKPQQYQLKLLKTLSIGDTGGDLLVTSWTAGDLKVEPVLTDGTHTVQLLPIEFTVATVIDPQKNPEGKPFPPMNPMTMGWPPWFWAMLASIVVMALACLAMAIFTYLQRRRFLTRLEQNKPALSPYNQFNKEWRKLVKGLPHSRDAFTMESSLAFFKELDTSLRWYLARELTIPVLSGGASSIVKEVKKANRKLFEEVGRELRLAFSEIEKARAAKEGGNLVDANQLAELTRALTDKIHQRLQLKKGA